MQNMLMVDLINHYLVSLRCNREQLMAKGKAQQSREASYVAAKKGKTFCSDYDNFFLS
jgi:hypothetical protein